MSELRKYAGKRLLKVCGNIALVIGTIKTAFQKLNCKCKIYMREVGNYLCLKKKKKRGMRWCSG